MRVQEWRHPRRESTRPRCGASETGSPVMAGVQRLRNAWRTSAIGSSHCGRCACASLVAMSSFNAALSAIEFAGKGPRGMYRFFAALGCCVKDDRPEQRANDRTRRIDCQCPRANPNDGCRPIAPFRAQEERTFADVAGFQPAVIVPKNSWALLVRTDATNDKPRRRGAQGGGFSANACAARSRVRQDPGQEARGWQVRARCSCR